MSLENHIITYHSTAIEGCLLTLDEIHLFLNKGVLPVGKSIIDVMMVKDHDAALTYILENAVKRKTITVELVKYINALVMRKTGSIYNTPLGQVDASKGEFRKGSVSAGGTYFPSYDKVEQLTKEFIRSLQEKMIRLNPNNIEEQLELSFRAHYNLVSIHPFYDGNGRTSRLVMNYIQAYYGLPLSIVFQEDKEEYFTALQKSNLEDNINWITAFLLKQYKKQNFKY